MLKMISELNILYITKLRDSKANGVTVAVSQLLNSISKYTNVAWLDIGDISIDSCNNVLKLSLNDWEKFDVDIAVFEDPFNDLRFCKLARILEKKRIPYILSPHGCFTKVAMKNKALKKYISIHTVFRHFLSNCYATQYLCVNERNNSIRFNEEIVIPNGILVNNDIQIRKDIKNIVFIGRKDVRHKGIDFLLKAILIEKEVLQYKNVKVSIYGSTESEKDDTYINNFIIENNLSDIVFNYGQIFGEEKKTVLKKSDLFILTSRHEGFPMSILEALSYGLPVLITEGTNMTDIIEKANAGWTCATDEKAISKKIENAVNCTDCSVLSRNAIKLANQYSWDSVSQETISKYNKIIEKS